jgi:carbonic anhydrase
MSPNADSGGLPPAVPPRAPVDFTIRFDPERPNRFFAPADWSEAAEELKRGNLKIVRFFEACARGGYAPGDRPPIVALSALEAANEPRGADGLPVQMPFGVVLGCSDARVPSEILFGQEFNDLFNIRVAGNVLGRECVGSFLYALQTFVPDRDDAGPRRLKIAIALGHRGCGAVRATLQAFDRGVLGAPTFDDPIGSILHRVHVPAYQVAAEAFDARFGTAASRDPARLDDMVDLVVYLNAAWSAREMAEWTDRQGPEIATRIGVVFGVVDPTDLKVRCRPASLGEHVGIFDLPPRTLDDLRGLAREIVESLSSA